MLQAIYKKFLVLRTLPVPVLAAINGPAVGAGAGEGAGAGAGAGEQEKQEGEGPYIQ